MKKGHTKLVANIFIITLIVAGFVWVVSLFWHPGSRAYTTNAQVRQDIVHLASRVQGFVKELRFDDFQYVHKGDTLVLIEDSEFQLQLAQAMANKENAHVGKTAQNTAVKTTQNNIAVSDAALDEVQVQVDNAAKEYKRYEKLLISESVTKQQFEEVETHYNALKAKYETLRRQQESARLMESEQTQRLGQSQTVISVAEAALELARLNLGYTVITAPCDGYTARKTLQVGELVHPGEELLSIVSDAQSWVIANFRERQMRHVSLGSKVKIKVDAIPGIVLHGRVAAISNATGDQYSIVPQDNSTGNFVKVEQLIPVKIALDIADNKPEDLRRLKSGLNVTCKIQ
ncbi:MAG: HlyD family secretion protein [Bacteroidales bacterium]|nr:HlyD family secretion protein [Bacteroidales bacterium]